MNSIKFIDLGVVNNEKTLISFENIEITVTVDEDGKTPLIQIDTPGMQENENGPNCKILLNDGPALHEPPPMGSDKT